MTFNPDDLTIDQPAETAGMRYTVEDTDAPVECNESHGSETT